MRNRDALLEAAYRAGVIKFAEEIGVQDPSTLLNPESQADAPEVKTLRRGWPDPLKRAKKLHEQMLEKNKVSSDDVKDKARLTKDSPEVTVG